MKKRTFQFVLWLVLSMVLWLGWGGVPKTYALTEDQQLVTEVWRIINRTYLDDTFNHQNWWFVRQRVLKESFPDRETAYGAIQAMLTSLDDPYTRFLRPEQYRSLQTSTSGELLGVGLQISQDSKDGSLRVISPIESSPADRAGIRSQDRILKIDGLSTSAMTLDEAASRMRGPIGTQVTLTISHDLDRPSDINLVRDRITLNPVYADLRTYPNAPKVGYIRLNQFNANAATELAAAIERLEKQRAEAYVLDLRNNPGGLLQAGVEIARYWLDKGSTIVYTVNRQGVFDSIEATGKALTRDPLIVLVNKGTASASEILAGALKDNGRAKLVGEATFGKGLIQSLFDLSDGSGLAVTVAKYETPDHNDINRLGIVPDQIVPLDSLQRDQLGTSADIQYQAAIDLLKNSVMVAGAS
ncbi:MAG: S41 family peptidase [Leptolyngbyaceae cyanobacterium MO_188.B28]|nr:S41 family peptidase [Leptolyngbyaceae cyanobacterium MO_188.B28]